MIKNYFSGMEEAVARLVSFFATLVFFSVYILSKDVQKISLDWSQLMIHLAVFWFVYELVGYFLFMVLLQFSKNKVPSKPKGYDIKDTNSNPEMPYIPGTSPLIQPSEDNLDQSDEN
jgi:hypothetical protein